MTRYMRMASSRYHDTEQQLYWQERARLEAASSRASFLVCN
jgi:hypothetical protein